MMTMINPKNRSRGDKWALFLNLESSKTIVAYITNATQWKKTQIHHKITSLYGSLSDQIHCIISLEKTIILSEDVVSPQEAIMLNCLEELFLRFLSKYKKVDYN